MEVSWNPHLHPTVPPKTPAQHQAQPEPDGLPPAHGGEGGGAATRVRVIGKRARDDPRGAREAQRRRHASKAAEGDELRRDGREPRAQGAAGLEKGAQEADAPEPDQVGGRRYAVMGIDARSIGRQECQ